MDNPIQSDKLRTVFGGKSRKIVILSVLVIVVLCSAALYFEFVSPDDQEEFENFSYIPGTSSDGIEDERSALLSHSESLRSTSYTAIDAPRGIEYVYNRSAGIGLLKSNNTSIFEDYIGNRTVLATNLSSENPSYDSQELPQDSLPYTGGRQMLRFMSFTDYSSDEIVQTSNGREMVYKVTGVDAELENRTESIEGELRLNENGYFSSIDASVVTTDSGNFSIQISIESVGNTSITEPDWLDDALQNLSSNSQPEVTDLTIPDTVTVGEETNFQILATDDNASEFDLEYLWEFGNNNSARGLDVSNTYNSEGEYQISITIRNPEDNSTTRITRNISVNARD